MSETKQPKKNIDDIKDPAKSTPASTSKPVIVTNRPILKDPMMVDKPEDGKDALVEPEKSKRPGKTTIKPLSPEDKGQADEPAKAADAEAPAEAPTEPKREPTPEAKAEAKPPDTETDKPAEKSDPKAEPGKPAPEATAAKPEEPAAEAAGDEDQPTESEEPPKEGDEDGQQSKIDKKLEAEAAEQAKRDTAIQNLVDSRKYELPIRTVEERKAQHFVILGVLIAIILVAAWLDVALDAGLIRLNGIHPVTHFFSN